MSSEIERFQDYKRRKREQLEETYEERRDYAMAHGTRSLYLVCPTCGQNRALHQHVAGESRFIEYDPERPLIQTRIGGGKMPGGVGVGWFVLDNESYNLAQVREYYPEIYEHMVACVSHLAGLLGITEVEEAEVFEEEIEEEIEEREEELEEVESVEGEVDMEGEEIVPPPVEIGYPYMWREQIVFLYRLHPQLTYSQIAERVGCTEGYVGSIIRRWQREGIWWPQP